MRNRQNQITTTVRITFSTKIAPIKVGTEETGYYNVEPSFYLRRFSESRSNSESVPSVGPSVRSSTRLSVRLSATLLGCLVCVICNSNSFHSFIFKLFLMIVHTLKMCTSYFNIFLFLGVLNLDSLSVMRSGCQV